MGGIWLASLVGTALKTAVWAIVEIVMFATIMTKECSGRIYEFGLSLVILHGLYLSASVLKCCCGGSK